MPIIPLSTNNRRPDDFPRISTAEQAARDAEAEQIVSNEITDSALEPPEVQAALNTEYRQRFNKEPPAARRGFVPLDEEASTPNGTGDSSSQTGFIPLESSETDAPSTMQRIAMATEPYVVSAAKTVQAVASGYPVAETAANLATMGAALPIAGIAGLGAAASKALGITDADPADVVHAVGNALTYQPKTELGQHLTNATLYPFEMLAKAGAAAGDKTLEATNSPTLATAVDTTINALPMLIAPGANGAKAAHEKFSTRNTPNEQTTKAPHEAPAAAEAARQPEASASHQGGSEGNAPSGFIPLEGVSDAAISTRAQRLAGDDPALHRSGSAGLEILRREGDNRVPGVDAELSAVPQGHGASLDAAALAGALGRERQLRAGELPVDNATSPSAAADMLPDSSNRWPSNDHIASREIARATSSEFRAAPGEERIAAGEPTRRETVSGVEMADAQRADATTSRVGEADRYSGTRPLVQDQERLAGRDGINAEVFPPPRQAKWGLIEADNVKPRSYSDAPDRHQQEMIVQDINREFTPGKLAVALDDAEGAPIVRRDGTVEAGHKRAEAIKRVYQADGQKAADYRAHLREAANSLGLDPATINQMKKPVLVRIPDEPRAAAQDMAAPVQNSWAPGANYAPMVDQMREPVAKAATVADLPKPIRREQIVSDLAKAMDTTIYEGRVKGKKRLGFFRPGVNEVRIKNASDIEVAAHEIAHLIDHRVKEISSAWRSDKALREELKSVSYDQQSVPEGFAEGVRLFLTQPETLEARAPRVYSWLNDFADKHQYGPALRKAQKQMTGWFGQDSLNRARSKIGTDKPLAEYFDRFWDKFRQSTVDDLHGIMQMERSLTGKINPNGPYESARLSRASASIADGAVRFGYPVKNRDGSFSWKGQGLEEILKPVAKSLDDALLYFVGRSSRELHGQGREHLFTSGEIDAMLRLRTPEREKAFQDYQTWNRGILDFAEAQNVINPESRRLWQRTQYLPFHRVEQPGGLKGKPGEWQGIQALTGGTTNIKDVLGNMVGNAAMLLDKSVKNEARLKIAKLSQREGGGKFMVKIDTDSRPVKISGDQVLDAMLKRYGIALDGDAPAFFDFLIKGQPPAGKNVVAVLQQGKPVWFEVGDPILYRALSAIDRPVQSEVVRWLGLPKRIGQATITMTPDFWMANIARDTLMGSVMSRSGFKPIIDSLQGMRLRMTNDPIYKDYIANGGGLSSIYLDEAALRTKLEKFYGRQGIDYRTVLDAPSKMLHFVETLGDAFEMSTRLGEYKKAIERGENPRHAAYQGREVSTDFAMRGDSKALGFMYDTVMFLKPALVSWDRLYRGLAHDPNKGAIAAKAGTIALLSAGLYLLNQNDPRYADLPDWDRDANWHFFVGENHFRYPKIWEIGALASGAERSVEKIMAADPTGLGKDFARILGATFNVNLMPQILAPLAEQAMNRNSFTKAPIETPGMENVQPFLRSKPGTSETMKAVGMATRDLPEALQVNPSRAEALLRGYFNTYAMYGLMLTDQALFGNKLPEKRTDELPVVRRFYANEPPKHTKYETEFYSLLQESKRLRGTLRELDDLGLREFADSKEQSPLAGEAKPLERAAKNLGSINNEMQAVKRNDALNPTEKRQKLDQLTMERNALLKAAVTESKAAQKLQP
ncbi:MAG: hypothetical protein EPO47_05095 [Rugosibacter sp.]|nr:MAG: hypothetical protein EPO60_04690 [Rugosibacter sp.]TBR09922.1 MAG: hypothetical protein EPO47_05095 [Rugosibacter sp.]